VRIELFRELACTELDLGDGRTGIIIGDLVVNFKSEGFEGDDLLIESQFEDFQDKSIRMSHRVIRHKDGRLIALVETGLVAFDYKKRIKTKWPEQFIINVIKETK
jgi:acyl-CoA thioesterase FadM